MLLLLCHDTLVLGVLPFLTVRDAAAVRAVGRDLHGHLPAPPRPWTSSPAVRRVLGDVGLAHFLHVLGLTDRPLPPRLYQLDPRWYALAQAGAWDPPAGRGHDLSDLVALARHHRARLRWPLQFRHRRVVAADGDAWDVAALRFRHSADWARAAALGVCAADGGLVLAAPPDGGPPLPLETHTLGLLLRAERAGLVAPLDAVNVVRAQWECAVPVPAGGDPLHLLWLDLLLSPVGRRLVADGVLCPRAVPENPLLVLHPSGQPWWPCGAPFLAPWWSPRTRHAIPRVLLWWDSDAARWAREAGLVACRFPTPEGLVPAAPGAGGGATSHPVWETRVIDALHRMAGRPRPSLTVARGDPRTAPAAPGAPSSPG